MGYRSPGLVQALCPGDVFILRNYDPDRNAGFTETPLLCVWRRDHRPEEPTHPDDAPTNYFIEVGVLELGRSVLRSLMLERFEAIEFPWMRSRG